MGKTTLVKAIIERGIAHTPSYNRYYIDTKQLGDFSSDDGNMIVDDHAPDAFTSVGHSMVWQPLSDDKEQYSKFFEGILKAKLPAYVDIDECANMRFGNDTIPRGLSLLLLQGRAAGINVIGGTQEVAKSPRQLASQATWVISFNLTNEYDEKTMITRLHLNGSPLLKRSKVGNRVYEHLGLKQGEFFAFNNVSQQPAKKYTHYSEFLSNIQ